VKKTQMGVCASEEQVQWSPDTRTVRIHSGRCTCCRQHKQLLTVTYDQGNVKTTRTNMCSKCILNETWIRVDLPQGLLWCGVGDKDEDKQRYMHIRNEKYLIFYRNKAQITTKATSEPVLQCRRCQGYQRTIYDLTFQRPVGHTPVPVRFNGFSRIEYTWSKLVPSVCEQCLSMWVFSQKFGRFVFK